MMTFAFFLLGGFAGIFAWLYIDHFIPNLQQEIYQNYIELYPENRPIFHSEKAAIQSQKCSVILSFCHRLIPPVPPGVWEYAALLFYTSNPCPVF